MTEKEYDNSNSGALWPPRNKPNSSEPNTRVMLTGKINDDGEEKRVVALGVTAKNGEEYIDLYEKVGTLYKNEYKKKDSSPDYSGPFGNRRVSAWVKKLKDTGMIFMSCSVSDKREGPDVGF